MLLTSVVVFVISIALIKRIDLFYEFIKGAKSGFYSCIKLIPTLIALMTCIGMFKASGGLDVLSSLLFPVAQAINMPREVIPLALIRPLSGSGALVVVGDILSQYGANSYIGRLASVMMGSTETTFYTIAVYFGATAVKKTGFTLICALIADFVGFLMSVITVNFFFPA